MLENVFNQYTEENLNQKSKDYGTETIFADRVKQEIMLAAIYWGEGGQG